MAWNVSMIPGGYRRPVNVLFVFNVVSTQTIAGQFSTASGKTITVYWGDGTSNTYSGTSQAYSKDYGSLGSRTVQVVGDVGSLITYTMTTSGANVQFALADLPSGFQSLTCTGSNTISGSIGDLPSTMTYLNVSGVSTISGSLADLPSGLTYFRIESVYTTVSGSLADLPSGITFFALSGTNTVTGSISDLPAALQYFLCTGNNTIDGYTTKTWADSQRRVYHVPVSPGGLSSAEIDQLLIDLAAAGGTWFGDKQIYLKGTNAARTSASDAAVATLTAAPPTGKGVTVTTT